MNYPQNIASLSKKAGIPSLHSRLSARHDYSAGRSAGIPDGSRGYAGQGSAHVRDQAPQDIGSRFGLRLRELRRDRKMTQLRMAVDFGIDRSFISDVERGKKSISLIFLEIIALGLRVELSELLRGL